MIKRKPQHRKSWIPTGVRNQPAWVFIGLLFVVTGLAYSLGQADSPVTKAIGNTGLRVWGTSMLVTGCLLIVATARAKPALEKLALRVVTCDLVAYSGWLLVVVPFTRAVTTIMLAVALIIAAEFRVAHLRALIRRTTAIQEFTTWDGDDDD